MDDQFTIYIEKMHKTHDNLMSELATIRAGRANPHVLDRITVDYYGTSTPNHCGLLWYADPNSAGREYLRSGGKNHSDSALG